MTDIHSQNSMPDQVRPTAAAENGSVQNFDPSVHLPAQAAGAQADLFATGQQPKGKRRPKKSNKGQQELAYADSQDQAANGEGAQKASGGAGGGGNTLLYVAGGLAVVGAGVGLAGGGGSAAPEVPKDTTPPTAPTAALATDTGSSTSDRITSNGRIDVGGLETGATWEYSTNGGTSWQAGTGTNFTLAAGSYADGSVLVRQKDAAGNVSANGKPAGAVTVDATAPTLPTIMQVTGDGIVNAAEKDAGVYISGRGEAGSSVSVLWGTVTKTTTVDPSGDWKVQFAPSDVPVDGATTVQVTLTDLAGNASATAQQAVTVDTRVTVQGSIVAGPLVAGHGLSVSLYASDGRLIQSGIAVANDGSFSARVAANRGDVLIAKVVDSGTGADYSDEATGASKDLNAALFAAIIVGDRSAAVQAQVNPVTTLAAIKAGLSVDGSGTIAGAAVVRTANALVAKAFGLDDITVAPVATNSGAFNSADRLSAAEKIGAVLAALSGVDAANAGDAQRTITALAAQIDAAAGGLTAEGQALILQGAAAASVRVEGRLESFISDLIAAGQQSTDLTINAIAGNNVVSATEITGLVLSGNVAAGATSVTVRLGSATGTAVIDGTTWSYAVTADDIAALGADGSKVISVTASLSGGATKSSSRPILLDTTGPADLRVDAVAGDNIVNAGEAGRVVLTGSVEPGSQVFIRWGAIDTNVTAGLDGRWSLDLSGQTLPADGQSDIRAYAVDPNGNRGAETRVDVAIDRGKPSKPEISPVSGDDNVSAIEASKPFVVQGTAEPGARVALRWGGAEEYSGNVDGNGRWSITIPAGAVPAAGAGQMTAYVIDAAGNRSDTSSRDVTVYGALVKPIIFPIAADNQVNSAESLSPDSVVVRGLAPPMSLIRLTWGNAQIVKADENGDWSATFGLTDLPIDGPWTVRAELVDEFDVPLVPTQNAELAVIIDTLAPAPVTLGSIAQDNIVNAKEKGDGIKISGSAEPLSEVTLIWGSTRKTVRALNGSWEIDLRAADIPADGTVPIQLVSKDAAGNLSVVTSRDIKIDTQLPDTPRVALQADTGISNSDNITSNGLLLLTGIEADASWSYSLDAGENWRIGGTTANAQLSLSRGEYEIGQIQVRQTDAAGNVSAVYTNNALITVDTSADQILVESITENLGSTAIVNDEEKRSGVTISGSFEPFSTIEVSWNGVVKSPNGPADEQGNWSVTFAAKEIPADGPTTVIVTGTDVAGNRTQRTLNVLVDTQAPGALSIGLSADTNIPNDGITRDPKVTVAGFEAGSSWEYSINGGQSWEDGNRILNGTSSFDLADGVYANGAIRVRQIDAAGNVGLETPLTGRIVVDTVAEGLTIGVVAGDGIVNLTERGGRVAVSGQAEAGATVAVTLAGVTTSTEAGPDGQWTVNYDALASLADGEYEISVVETDVAGNVSAPVRTRFTIDTARPEDPTLAAVTGDNKINAAEISAGLTLSGTAVANGKVRLNWGTGDVLVDVNAQGVWSTPWDLGKLPEDGSRTLSVTAINAIGNVSRTIEQVVTIDRQVLPPTVDSIASDGTVNAAEKAQGVTVTGLAEAGASVTIAWGSVSKTVQAAQNGQWSTYFGPTEIPADGSTTMILSQTDVLGNASGPLLIRPIVDSGLPAIPTISTIANDDILIPSERTGMVTVSGSAEANSKVIVTFGGVSQEVPVGPQRTWTAEFSGSALPASGDTQVTAQVKDSAGNLSDVASRIVTFVSGAVTAPIIGAISVDNAVNAAEKPVGVRISGLAAANETVVVQIGTLPAKSFTTGSTGAWSVSFSEAELPNDGSYTVTATAPSGTASRQLLLDIGVPQPAGIAPVATDGIIDALEKAQGITITGTAEAGAQVSVLWAGIRKAATVTGTTWSASFAPNEIAGDSSSVAQVTVRDAAGNQSTASANIMVATTPHIAISKAGAITATADMFGLSDTANSASSLSISVSGLSNGAFTKNGVAASTFTLQEVKDGTVLFTHNGSNSAPAYSVALSFAGVTTNAKAAFVAFSSSGTNDADVLTGTSAADLIIGLGGDDLLIGGAGNDIFYGHSTGSGGSATDNDVFKWSAGDAGQGAFDVIRDFAVWNGTSGDKLDISALLQGYTSGSQSLDQWVTVRSDVVPSNLSGWDATRSGTLITIDLDGPSSGTVKQSIFLEGVSLGAVNVNNLVSTGVIIA